MKGFWIRTKIIIMSFTKNIHPNHHDPMMISLKFSITVVFLVICSTMMVQNIQCQTTAATTTTKASTNQTTNSTMINSNSTNLNNNGSIVNNTDNNNNTNSNSFDNNNSTGLNTTNSNNNNSISSTSTSTTTTTTITTTTTNSSPDLRGTHPTLRYTVFAKWLKSNDQLNDSRQDVQSQVWIILFSHLQL